MAVDATPDSITCSLARLSIRWLTNKPQSKACRRKYEIK